jgi:hypothetical protein
VFCNTNHGGLGKQSDTEQNGANMGTGFSYSIVAHVDWVTTDWVIATMWEGICLEFS